MALRNSSGHYFKVLPELSSFTAVIVEGYVSETVRRDGPGPFDAVMRESIYVSVPWTAELAYAPKGNTLLDSLTRSMYAAVKQDPKFSGMEDC